jgi:hypothetical protein
MVFVIKFLFTSVVIILLVHVLSYFKKMSLTKDFLEKLAQIEHIKVFINYLVICTIIITFVASPYLLVFSLVLIVWIQKITKTQTLYDTFIFINSLVSKTIFSSSFWQELVSMYISPNQTIYELIYDSFCEFKTFIRFVGKVLIDDFKTILSLTNPQEIYERVFNTSENLRMRRLFWLKLYYTEDELKDKSEEDLLKFYKKIQDQRNPSIKFNKVSRLPYSFSYSYIDFQNDNTFIINFNLIYNFFKYSILSISIALLYFLYTIFFFKIQFLKQISLWLIVLMIFFWLISGFNFFLKRYQFSKFTSQIQRFWKRTNICFWLIEGFLLLLFFYYYLNSSQEPNFMYDYSSLNQEYLISTYTIFLNILILSIIIYIMYFTLIRINSNSWEQLSIHLLIISIFIFSSFYIETYQFYYVISIFNERLWVFNEEENIWAIDIDNPILRTKLQYFSVCLIAKYWHFLFIFLSWVFFVIKSFERKKITYVLFGLNLQNIIILYFLNLACYLQWFKWLYRRFFDLPYTWFFTNIDNKLLYNIFLEIKLIITNLINLNIDLYKFTIIVHKSLTLWNVDSLCTWKFI